jgi:hypothetical protein
VTFEFAKGGGGRFHGIHPVLEGILRTVALDPWERCPEGSARLLPPPGEDEELCIDWQDHVQPELRRGFDAARAVVEGDLATMVREKDETWSLQIPADHGEAWLSTLNALRLALASEHVLTEAELSEREEPDFSTPRGLAVMQVNFFAFIQECLIRAMEGDGE